MSLCQFMPTCENIWPSQLWPMLTIISFLYGQYAPIPVSSFRWSALLPCPYNENPCVKLPSTSMNVIACQTIPYGWFNMARDLTFPFSDNIKFRSITNIEGKMVDMPKAHLVKQSHLNPNKRIRAAIYWKKKLSNETTNSDTQSR